MSSGPSDQWPAGDPRPQSYEQGQAYEQIQPPPGPAAQGGAAAQAQGDWRPGPQPHEQPSQYGQPQPYSQVQPYGQPQAGYPQAGYPAGQVVAPKNPAIGVLLSFFIPGLGTMVNGNVGRGALILGLYAVGWILSFILIGIPLLIGAWIWGMVDGYTSAQRWNQQHGIIS